MRKLISSTLGLYLAAAGVAHGQEDHVLPAPQPSKAVTQAPTASEKLAAAVAVRLRANTKLKNYHVDVEVSDGVVELTGNVVDAKQRDEVVQTVQSVRGVRRVNERLVMTDGSGVTAPETPKTTTKETRVEPETAPVAAAVPAAAATPQVDAATVQAAVVPVQTIPPPAAPQQIDPAPVQLAPTPVVTQPVETAPVQAAPAPTPFAPIQVDAPQAETTPMPTAPMHMLPVHMAPMQMAPMQTMQPQFVWAPAPGMMQPGMAPRPGMPPEPLPIFTAQPGMPNPHLQPPPMPPYAWPTFAPYNNVSRVAYPNNYPYEAWPFIGPMYPFPKVPLGWRNVTLGWRDGYWWYGRDASGHDWWRIRYW